MLSKEQNELVTRTGADTPAGKLFRQYWQPIAMATDFPADGAPIPVKVLGEELVLFKDEAGELGLLGLHCPHRGGDLSYGRVEDGGLRCIYHGWLFDRTGKCLQQPAEPPGKEFCHKIKHSAYPVRELGGLIFAYLGADEPPVLPEWECLTVPPSNRYIVEATAGHIGDGSCAMVVRIEKAGAFGSEDVYWWLTYSTPDDPGIVSDTQELVSDVLPSDEFRLVTEPSSEDVDDCSWEVTLRPA